MSSPVDLSRRAALLGGLGLLAGCGFKPVYAPGVFGGSGAATAGLALINVTRIPERSGQLLRQSLQQHLEGAGADDAKRYDLDVLLAFSEDGMAILPDNSTSRMRYSAAATFVLHARDEKRTAIANGSARQVDAANIIDNQYFAADMESETITKRLMEGLGSQITLQLAAFFKNHPDAAKPAPEKPDAAARTDPFKR